MSYLVNQKVRNRIYVYEATNHWDPVLKQSRQKRIYIGVRDPVSGDLIPAKGRLVPTKESKKSCATPPAALQSYEYGPLYLLNEIAKNVGVSKALEESLGSKIAKQVLSLSFFQLLESKSFHLYESWVPTVDPELVSSLTSQRISELLTNLGQQEININAFFHSFKAFHGLLKGVWIDISSLSSYSSKNNFVEWGYNRDGEDLPQINLGIMMGYPANLPFYYHLYPGSVPDVSTLKNISLKAKDLGISLETWIMDRGFFSAANIQHMGEEGFSFVTCLPSRMKEYQRLIKEFHPSSSLTCFSCGKDLLFYEETTCVIGKDTLRAIVFLNQKRATEETQKLIINLENLTKTMSTEKFTDLELAQEFMDIHGKNLQGCYSLVIREGIVVLERQREGLDKALKKLGKIVLLTNQKEMSAQELLEKYREKDRVEKVFDALKNEINESRLRVQSQTNMSGKMFITFVSLIVYTHLMNTLSKARNTLKNMTFQEILMTLRKLRSSQRPKPHPSLLSEISKKQKLIFHALQISTPSLVIIPGS